VTGPVDLDIVRGVLEQYGRLSVESTLALVAEVEALRVLQGFHKGTEESWRVTADEARGEAARLRAALAFYADPETYHAVAFMFDPPCGGFDQDFSEVDHPHYRRHMPGKTARDALRSPTARGES
jgi:hypothetical protein